MNIKFLKAKYKLSAFATHNVLIELLSHQTVEHAAHSLRPQQICIQYKKILISHSLNKETKKHPHFLKDTKKELDL